MKSSKNSVESRKEQEKQLIRLRVIEVSKWKEWCYIKAYVDGILEVEELKNIEYLFF